MSNYTTSILPNFIRSFLSTASTEQKQCVLKLLNEDINASMLTSPITDEPTKMPLLSPPTPLVHEKSSIPDYVKHIPDIGISEELSNEVMAELESLKLRSHGSSGRPAKVKTQWLSPLNVPYNYGKVINKPKPIKDFPAICKVMELLNSNPYTSGDMTACLVNCLSTANSNLSYHSDHQGLIAQNSDICTVSFGSARTLDFIWKKHNPKGRKGPPPPADFSVPAGNHSLNIMKPGCQQVLNHRVPPGKVAGVRYSLSFRKIVVPESSNTAPPPLSPTQAKPQKLPNQNLHPHLRRKLYC